LLRIVLDSSLRIPLESKLLEPGTLIVTTEKAYEKGKEESILDKGAEIFIAEDEREKCNLSALLCELGKRNIQRLLVEGGPTVITAFLEQKLADEAIVYIASKTLGSEGAAAISQAMKNLIQKEAETTKLDGDIRIISRLSN
jgi:diaminohydroxyphosphoribosylaminopyrimidine deaminase/5-amino-6-(5-phosphoribosylamino)uracil reductase